MNWIGEKHVSYIIDWKKKEEVCYGMLQSS